MWQPFVKNTIIKICTLFLSCTQYSNWYQCYMLLLYVKAIVTVYPICDWPCLSGGSTDPEVHRGWEHGQGSVGLDLQPTAAPGSRSKPTLLDGWPTLIDSWSMPIEDEPIHIYGPTLIDYKVVLTNLASRRQTQAYRQLAYAYKRLTQTYIWQTQAYRPRLIHPHRLQSGAHNPHP